MSSDSSSKKNGISLQMDDMPEFSLDIDDLSSLEKEIRPKIAKIAKEIIDDNIKNIFYAYEKQNFDILGFKEPVADKWIKENLPNFRFCQVVYFFDQSLKYFINQNLLDQAFMLTRDEKRSNKSLQNYLNRFWNDLKPLYDNYINSAAHLQLMEEIKSKFKLVIS